MSHRIRIIALAGLGGVLVLGLLLWGDRSGGGGIPARTLLSEGEGSPFSVSRDAGEVGGTDGTVESQEQSVVPTSERAVVAPSAIAGWVVAEDGTPLEGAALVLTALTPRDASWEPAWREGEWGPLDSPTSTTSTRADGGFTFAEWIGEGAEGSFVLSASKSGYGRTTRSFPYPVPTETTLRLVLRPAADLEVTVLGKGGVPVADAQVDQFGLVPGKEARGSSVAPEESRVGNRFVHGIAITDETGQVRLPWMDGEQVLVASRGSQVSVPWRGTPHGKVVLHLRESFRLGGTIQLPDWSELNYEGERRLRVTAVQGGLERSLATLRHVQDGEWGPLQLPCIEDAMVRVVLEGSPIVPVEKTFAVPPPGSEITINLVAKRGKHVWLLALDSDQNPIPFTKATLKWKEEGNMHQVSRGAGGDGYIDVWAFPREVAAHVNVLLEAPGYVTREFPDRDLSFNEDEESLSFVLQEAGTVRGHCMSAGVPVSDFTVLAVSGKDAFVYTKEQFWAREDGSFELTGVAPGPVLLVASSADHPPSEPFAVSLPEGGVAQIELELGAGTKRAGIVVDGSTGKPIPGARIRQSVTTLLNAEQWWGPDVYSDDGGNFVIGGMKGGTSSLEIGAHGYSTEFLRVSDSLNPEAKPLHVELFPLQSLEVKLAGWPSGDYSEFAAQSIANMGEIPEQPFSPGGDLVYGEVGEGRHTIQITGPLGPTVNDFIEVTFSVDPGAEKTLRLRVADASRLTVRYRPPRGSSIPPGTGLEVKYRTAQGLDASRWGELDASGTFSTDCIEGDSVWVQVMTPDRTVLAGGGGLFRDGELTLELDGSKKPFVLEVVDHKGRLIPGVQVLVWDPATASVGPFLLTDAEGRVTIPGLASRVLRAELFHESRGTRVAVEIDGRKTKAKVLLDDTAGLVFSVSSGSSPLTGATAMFLDGAYPLILSRRRTDSRGDLAWTRLTPGSYHVRVTAPGHWPLEITGEATKDPAPQPLTLRRLGDLLVRVVREEGMGVSGLRLVLTDDASGERVSDWVRDELVTSAGEVTDRQGGIRFSGLPEGEYEVRTEGPAGRILGTATVVGGERSEVGLVLPSGD